jgi:hypothetical protein
MYIRTREESDRYVQMMEDLDRRSTAGQPLAPEEEALLALLERLIEDHCCPAISPIDSVG